MIESWLFTKVARPEAVAGSSLQVPGQPPIQANVAERVEYLVHDDTFAPQSLRIKLPRII